MKENFGVSSNPEWTVSEKWYEKNGIRYPRSTAVLKHSLYNPELEAWRLRVGWDNSEKIRVESADRGTRVHNILRKIANEIPLSKTEEKNFRPYIRTFNEFLSHYNPRFISTERTLFSERNVFATTVDAVATIMGLSDKPLAVEYKTSRAFYPSHFYQGSAERFLLEESGTTTGGSLIVRINPDSYDTFFMQPNETEMYFNRFLSFLDHFKEFDKDYSKR